MTAETKAPTRRATVRKVEAMLLKLLRTPKTRSGLIAASKGSGVTRNFLYGWLTEQVRSGDVAELKSVKPAAFQLAELVSSETPPPGFYPEWLEPRALPEISGRRAYFDGRAASTQRVRATK